METQGATAPLPQHDHHWTREEVDFVTGIARREVDPVSRKVDEMAAQLRRRGIEPETSGQRALRYALLGTGVMIASVIGNKLYDWAFGGATDEMETPRGGARARA